MPTGFNRILIGVVFFGLCVGISFGAGTVWGRNTAPKAAAAAVTATGTGATGARTGASGATGGTTGTFGASGASGAGGASGGRGAFGASGAAGVDGTPAAGIGNGFARRAGVVTGVTGTVESVSGQTLTITPSGGTGGATQTPETVTVGSTTAVGTVTKGDASALRAGDTVLITGQRGTDGSLTATSVMVLPQGFLQP